MDEKDRISDRQFECIEDFLINLYDEDCFSTDEYKTVQKGSCWVEDTDTNYIGGEIHLDCFETLDWIEITKERLDKYFKLLP